MVQNTTKQISVHINNSKCCYLNVEDTLMCDDFENIVFVWMNAAHNITHLRTLAQVSVTQFVQNVISVPIRCQM